MVFTVPMPAALYEERDFCLAHCFFASGIFMDKTLLKGLRALETLARSDGPRGVTELAAELELTKSNVHRILQGLAHQGFVRKVGDQGRYEPTLKLWELGAHVMGRLDVPQIALPHMERLARDSNETVHLSTLDGIEALYLAKIDSPQPVRAYTTVGGRAPAQCVATGKAQLAWADADTLAAVKLALSAYTPKSIIRAEQLDQELEKVRTQGFAINTGEWREQVYGMAAPIMDSMGRVVASLGISGPADRLKPRLMQSLAPTVQKACSTISLLLGYRNPR